MKTGQTYFPLASRLIYVEAKGNNPFPFNSEHGPKPLVQYADQLELLTSRPGKVRYIR